MSFDIKYIKGDVIASPTGDLVLSESKSDLARQWVEIRLKTILTEWFLDQTQGIDWLSLLSKRGTQLQIDSVIRRTITQTQYITRILTYQGELDRSTQKYNVTFTAEIESGDVITVNNLEI